MEDKRKDEEENSRNARIHSPLHLSQLSSLFSFSWLHELLSSPSLLQTFPWKSLLSLLALRAPIAALEPWARSPFRIRRKATLLELLKRRTLRIGSLRPKNVNIHITLTHYSCTQWTPAALSCFHQKRNRLLFVEAKKVKCNKEQRHEDNITSMILIAAFKYHYRYWHQPTRASGTDPTPFWRLNMESLKQYDIREIKRQFSTTPKRK